MPKTAGIVDGFKSLSRTSGRIILNNGSTSNSKFIKYQSIRNMCYEFDEALQFIIRELVF